MYVMAKIMSRDVTKMFLNARRDLESNIAKVLYGVAKMDPNVTGHSHGTYVLTVWVMSMYITNSEWIRVKDKQDIFSVVA